LATETDEISQVKCHFTWKHCCLFDWYAYGSDWHQCYLLLQKWQV